MFKSKDCALAVWEGGCQCLGKPWAYPETPYSFTNEPGECSGQLLQIHISN